MKASITKMNKTLGNQNEVKRWSPGIGILVITILLLLLWQGLSLVYSPLVLPGPVLTVKSLLTIMQSKSFFGEILVTLRRLLIALLASISIGSLFGILMGGSKKIRNLFEPLIYLVQATPPILYMTLAMLWFGLNGRATIFIVFIGSAPVMAVNIKEGFENIDTKLIEMGKAFKFSRTEMIKEIILPSLSTYFKAGLITVFSFGWKLVVMGEVLSSSTGLGAQITDARMNLETNMVFAWGIIIVLLCFLFQKATAKIFELKPKRRKCYDKQYNIQI